MQSHELVGNGINGDSLQQFQVLKSSFNMCITVCEVE